MANAAKITERGIDGVVVEAPIPASQPGDTFPAGAILLWGAAAAPSGWIICDGSAISRAGFPTLFTNYGTVWGAGDGSTTFNVPDLRGRVPVGVSGSHALAAVGGAETHAITVPEMPAHTHTGPSHTHGINLNTSAVATGIPNISLVTALGSSSNIPEGGAVGTGHSYAMGDPGHFHNVSGATAAAGTGATGSAGSGTAMSLMQPFVNLNFIIRAY